MRLSTTYEVPRIIYEQVDPLKLLTERFTVSESRATIQLLLEHGALWRPDDKAQIGQVRRSLSECEADITLELVERLVKHSACTQDTIRECFERQR
jgi:hypothetical protein